MTMVLLSSRVLLLLSVAKQEQHTRARSPRRPAFDLYFWAAGGPAGLDFFACSTR
jgi:hypothetical protein